MSDSRGSSIRGSPSQSEDEHSERGSQTRLRSKKSGFDLDQEEGNLRKVQQEAQESIASFTDIRNKAQSNTRKIHDMQVQFEEARMRIDKLNSRRARGLSDYDPARRSSSTGVVSSSGSATIDTSSSTLFAPVTMSVDVSSDQDC